MQTMSRRTVISGLARGLHVLLVVVGFALVGWAGSRLGHAQAKPNITGTWAFEVSTQAGTGNATVTFKQDGEKLTGHYSGSTLGEADLTGTVTGTSAKFGFAVNVQGNPLDVSYDATIDSHDAMKGSLQITAIGGGTFTGKRTK